MAALTITQFAETEGISYEAVRQQIRKAGPALDGHIFKISGVKYLDEWAVDFLRERRRKTTVYVHTKKTDDEVEALQKRVEDLTARLLAAQDMIAESRKEASTAQEKLIETQQRVIALQENETKYLESRLEVDGIRADRDRLAEELTAAEARETIAGQTVQLHREEAERAREDAEIERRRADDLQKEVERFRPSIFGFYRKV